MKNTMVPRPPFRPLVEELRSSTAGYFDGESAWVKAEHLNSPVVAVHEGQHEWIMMRTPDGSLIRIARMLIRHRDHKVRTLASDFFARTVDDTRRPHEVCATYLGIKFLRVAQIPEALKELPDEYLDYYGTLASVLDARTNCTFYQYALAVAVATFVFSSPALQGLAASPSLVFPNRGAAAEPCARLEWALQWLRVDDGTNFTALLRDCQHAAEEAQLESDEVPWDIDIEHNWRGPARPAKEMVEKAIIDVTGARLTAAYPAPTLDADGLLACAARLREEFRGLGIELAPWSNTDDSSGIDLTGTASAFASGNSRLHNVPQPDSPVLHPETFLRGIQANANLRWIAIRRAPEDRGSSGPGSPWKLLPAELGPVLTYDYCSYATDAQLATLLRGIRDDRFANALPLALVLKREAGAGPAVKNVLETFFARRNSRDYPAGTVAPWQYVEQGWADFVLEKAIEARSDGQKLILGRVVLTAASIGDTPAPSGVTLCYATNEDHNHYACKVFTLYSATAIIMLENKLIEAGVAKRLRPEDLKAEKERAGASCARLLGEQLFHAFAVL